MIINNAENWYEEYEEEINQILSTVEFVYYETNTPIAESAEIIIDSASFDIDGDGIIEDCKIADGPTSGLFTVVITACSAKEQTAGKIDNTGNEASVDEPYVLLRP